MTSHAREFIHLKETDSIDGLINISKLELLTIARSAFKQNKLTHEQFIRYAVSEYKGNNYHDACDFFVREFVDLIMDLSRNEVSILHETIRLMKEMLEKDDDPIARLEYLEEIELAEEKLNDKV